MATKAKAEKYVYSFGGGKADGNESMKIFSAEKARISQKWQDTKI